MPRDLTMSRWPIAWYQLAAPIFLSAVAFCATPDSALAQYYDPCPYTNDGDCDEPNGLGYCAWGTDTADCSNPNANYGGGSGYLPGSSVPTSTPNTGSYLLNPCPYLNDRDCDEPNGLGLCAWGTDTADCSNPSSNFGGGSGFGTGPAAPTPPGGFVNTPGGSYLLNPCPHLNDGDCDEPNGLNLCAPGTDVADCSNPNSNFGGGSGYAGPGGSSAGSPGTGAGNTGAGSFFPVALINGLVVDNCIYYGRSCHQPAADEFCQRNGYARATAFDVIRHDPTYVMGDNVMCNGSHCGGLFNVQCVP